MKKVLWHSVLLLICGGCVSSEKYSAAMDSWLGADVNKLVDSWGYPDNTLKIANGNTVYIYNRSTSYTTPVTVVNPVYGTSYASGGQTVNLDCQTFFEVDKNNQIVNWQWKGNNCVSN